MHSMVGLSLALALIALVAPARQPAADQAAQVTRHRLVDLGPGLRLDVRAVERDTDAPGRHRIQVQFREESGGLSQTLAYTSDWPLSASPEGRVCFQDHDFDGYKDMVVLRELAGKFVSYSVWHFDPAARRFVKDELANDLTAMQNLRIDTASHRLVTSSIGPTEPWRKVYSVENGKLQLEESCIFQNDRRGRTLWEGTIVRTVRGQPMRRSPFKGIEDKTDLPCSDKTLRDEAPNTASTCL